MSSIFCRPVCFRSQRAIEYRKGLCPYVRPIVREIPRVSIKLKSHETDHEAEFRKHHQDMFEDYDRYMSEQSSRTSEAIERVNAMDTSNQMYMLNQLFHKCDDLTGDELKSIVNGRRLQFNTDNPECISITVYPDIWNTNDRMWNGMANILNMWSVGDQVRKIQVDRDSYNVTVVALDIPNFPWS